MRRVLLVLCLLAGPSLVGVGTAHAQRGDPPQHRLLVSSHGVAAAAELGSFCRWTTVGRDDLFCSDSLFTMPASSVPAHGGGAVLIVTGVRVDSIMADLPRRDGPPYASLRVVPADTSRRSFIAVLPPGPLRRVLSVSTRYSAVPAAGGSSESGDASFSIGLAHHRHVRPKQVTARATARCGRPRGRRRSCRLDQRGRITPVASGADCREGHMLVRLIARGRSVLRARARTSGDCRYRIRGRRFLLPLGARQVVLRTRFLGSASLADSDAPSVRLRPVFR